MSSIDIVFSNGALLSDCGEELLSWPQPGLFGGSLKIRVGRENKQQQVVGYRPGDGDRESEDLKLHLLRWTACFSEWPARQIPRASPLELETGIKHWMGWAESLEVKICDPLEKAQLEATAVVVTELEVGLGIGFEGEEGRLNICS